MLLDFTVINFNFAKYSALLDLPSFPTRRSSDLCSGGRAVGSGRGLLGGRGRPALTSALARTARSVRSEDRKSTRLNSSHSQISYAVFCLKKKKASTAI